MQTQVLSRQNVIALLQQHKPEFEAFGVQSIGVFGSVARNQATSKSDVDILVDFNRPIGLFDFIRLQMRLEEILGVSVDLVQQGAVRKEIRDEVYAETVYA